jgi:hypothetical protein
MSYAYLFKYIIIGDTGESVIDTLYYALSNECWGCILIDILWVEIVSHFGIFV